MSTTMDRRIADRRHSVREDGARRRLRRLLGVLVLVALGATAGWLLYHSPYFAVSEITIGGEQRSRAADILEEQGVHVGAPTIEVRGGEIEAALLEDPWIAAATVRVTWPGTVTVDVLEETPAAWVEAQDRWLLVAGSGTVLDVAEEFPGGLARIAVGSAPAEPGESVDAATAAAVTFIRALPPRLADAAEIAGDAESITAQIEGHHIVLGYPIDMEGKAATLAVMLADGIPEGAEVNLVSPERPAVKPQPLVESSS